ncbi:MAG TPA: hypothetical protein PKW95_05760 [bacterium]|nr:hypothetical protein [bacterium]HPQ68613.1 hypothetical protein [bacterium]
MKIRRFIFRYLWLWFLLIVLGGILFFTLTGNDPLLPAIYR